MNSLANLGAKGKMPGSDHPGLQRGLGRINSDGPPPRWGRAFSLVVMLAAILAGCATPVGLKPAGLRGVHLEVSAYALSGSTPSYHTKVVLQRYGLV
jgi:hypothetical protein